jgi:hypothetical protein
VVAIAPAFTIGLVRPPSPRSTAASELKASPVAFTPTRRRTSSGPSAWQTRANTNGLATLMTANSYLASPAAWTLPLVPAAQIPNSPAGTAASAGYTRERSPSATIR